MSVLSRALYPVFLDRFRGLAPLVLRVALGVIFIGHGWMKIGGGIGRTVQTMGRLGLPAPAVVAWAVALLELVGGALLILGLLTRLLGLLFALLMVGTTLLVKFDRALIAPGGAELDLALLAGAIGVMLLGPGLLAIDLLVGPEGSRYRARRQRARGSAAA